MTSELIKQEEKPTADKLDKFRDHLLHRKPLKPSEHATLEKYRKCFAWRCKLFSPQQVVTMLMQEYDLRYSQAYQLMADSTRLYGKVEDVDREGTRKVLIETLYVAMSIALKDKNADAIIAATKEIARLSKLNDSAAPLSADELMPARVAKYVQNNITLNNFGGTTPNEVVEGQASE